jgi:hypothetical protein
MNLDAGHQNAGKGHIKTLLRRRDHLKEVASEKLFHGREASYDLAEISAINSVLNELLALRASQPGSNVDENPPEDEPDFHPIEIDALAVEDALEMFFPKEYPIEVKLAKRIRFLPTAEVRITRTTSPKMDLVNIGLWKLKVKKDEWHDAGHFRIPVVGFSALVQELKNLEIAPVAADPA